MEMTLSRNNLPTCFVPNCNRIHGANVAGAQQPLAVYLLGGHEYSGSRVVEDEGLRGFRHAVAESHAQRSIDAHAQAPDDALFEVAHDPRLGPVITVKRPTRACPSGVSM